MYMDAWIPIDQIDIFRILSVLLFVKKIRECFLTSILILGEFKQIKWLLFPLNEDSLTIQNQIWRSFLYEVCLVFY